MEAIRNTLKRIIPTPFYTALQPYYHFALAYIGAVRYHHPSRKITVIGVTGTKGKSSTVELLARMLRAHGIRTASLSTIQFSIDTTTERNRFKMTMPGRFFIQRFLRQAVDAGCTHAVLEMSSEGAKQYRHRFIEIDGLIFTNLTPEHIESHGSFEKYKLAKLSIAEAVANSKKRPRFLAANVDDEHGANFLAFPVEEKLPYSLSDLTLHSLQKDSVSLVQENVTIRVPLVGLFNVYNVLAALTVARRYEVTLPEIRDCLRDLPGIAGRVQHVTTPAGAPKPLTAIVDYAHTPDSLQQLYEAFPTQTKICVLGNTGGGRDTWKRPEMGAIAEAHCDRIILTNEDPYDEDPRKILTDMQKGMNAEAPVEVILDRTEAIRHALAIAPAGGYVIVSGKGTDPYIMGPNGSKQPWSDGEVVTRELEKLTDSVATE